MLDDDAVVCSSRFKSQVQEVLISVQRMEESLKRLKKVKGQTQPQLENSKIVSDDDKIRLQIQTDVNFFSAKVGIFLFIILQEFNAMQFLQN
jgi:hypothetical protein